MKFSTVRTSLVIVSPSLSHLLRARRLLYYVWLMAIVFTTMMPGRSLQLLQELVPPHSPIAVEKGVEGVSSSLSSIR